MKRLFLPLTLLLTMILSPTLLTAAASETQTVILNGTVIATTTNNLLPLREVVTRAGGTVAWDSNTNQVTIRRGNRTAQITIGTTHATVNGRAVQLTTPPVLIEGRTMVSLCFIANHLGLGAGHINNRFILSTVPARQIPVLIYHHILPDEVNTNFRENAWTVSTETFAQQMRYLYENGFYTPTLDELKAFLYEGRPLPANSVMIHFDDGYYSNYVYAYPILERYGLRAVIFPITAQAQAMGDYQPSICHDSLTRAAAITLRTPSYVFETASHTHNMHHHAYGTSQSIMLTATREEIVQDTLQSFEFVGNHRAFAFPYGHFNNNVVEALAEAGITMAFTTRTGYITASSDPLRLNRFTIYRDTTMARFRAIVNRRA